MLQIYKDKPTKWFSKECLRLKCIHQKWESSPDLVSAINRWLISISKSVLKVWTDWNSVRRYLQRHHWTASFLLLLISQWNIILMAHWLPGRFSQKDRIYGSVPVEKTHKRAAHFTSPFTPLACHPQHTHIPSWFAVSLLPLSFCLSRSLRLAFLSFISFQSAEFPWHSWAMCHHCLQQVLACMHPLPTHTSPHTHMHVHTQTHLLVLSYSTFI